MDIESRARVCHSQMRLKPVGSTWQVAVHAAVFATEAIADFAGQRAVNADKIVVRQRSTVLRNR